MKSKVFALISLAWCISAYAQQPQPYKELSESFRCPETLKAREQMVKQRERVSAWVSTKYPNSANEKFHEIYNKLLKENHCLDMNTGSKYE
jgi:hypothetical protein